MARKLEAFPLIVNGKAVGTRYWFVCPGCEEGHSVDVRTDGGRPNWTFSGSLDFPTFTPSVFYPDRVCHFFIRSGRMEFLADCTHPLAGKIVDMLDI